MVETVRNTPEAVVVAQELSVVQQAQTLVATVVMVLTILLLDHLSHMVAEVAAEVLPEVSAVLGVEALAQAVLVTELVEHLILGVVEAREQEPVILEAMVVPVLSS
jgi:hypothetical protein